MLLKGFPRKLLIATFATFSLWFVCAVLGFSQDFGISPTLFSEICFAICSALTFSNGLFDGISNGFLSMGLPLLVTALIGALTAQGIHFLLRSFTPKKQEW